MTDRERMIRTLSHKSVDRVVWQPRIEHWFNVNTKQGTLPERYREMSLIELYDDLGCSVRAYDYYNQAIERIRPSELWVEIIEDTPKRCVDLLHTPVGTLQQVLSRTEESSLVSEFYVKRIEDLEVIEYLIENEHFHFNLDTFHKMDGLIGDRCAPVIFNLRTPLMRMFIEYIGFETTIILMHEHPDRMERFIRFMEETDDRYYTMVKESPVGILNFGDNVDSNMLPPSLMRKWTLPYYQRRTAELREAGMLTYPHWDGALKGLLPFVKEAGFDGYEALTPEPMGDVTIYEIAEALGHEYVLMDGIPASMFCEPFSAKDIENFAILVLDLFSPSLILGVSDEMPPNADIERVRLVSEIVRDYHPPIREV